MTNENLDDLPSRAPEHISETESRIAVRALLKDPYFLVQNEDDHDYGVDFHAEILVKGHPSNWRIHIQVKSVSHDANKDGSISRSVERTNLNYLLGSPGPMYVIYNAKTKVLMYRWAHDVLSDCRASGKSWQSQESITVRCREVLDGHAVAEIHSKLSAYFRNARDMRAANPSFDAILRQMDEIASVQSKNNAIAELLTREAAVHFERGQASGARMEFKLASTNLRDALRLAVHDQPLRMRISVALGGVLVFLGEISEAETVLKSVLPDLEVSGDSDFSGFATGNLGLAWMFQNRPVEAGPLLEKSIRFFAQNDNHYELARTYQLLAQNSLNAGNPRQAHQFLNEFTRCIEQVDPLASVPLLSAAWGTRGNMEMDIYKATKNPKLLRAARDSFSQSFDIASKCGTPYTILMARVSLAQCTWYENNLEKARRDYLGVADEAVDYVTIELQARYNAALVLFEMDKEAEALAELQALKPRYALLGDQATVEDIDEFSAVSRTSHAPVRPGAQLVARRVKIGRNDPCPCGSGKKYKKCCWTGE